MSASEERKFMHDLANPLAVAHGNVKIIIRKLRKDENAMTVKEIMERLDKTIEALDRTTEMMAGRRAIIIEQQKAGEA